MREKLVLQLIRSGRGALDAEYYSTYKLRATEALQTTAREILDNVPPLWGACAMLSAHWAAILREQYAIPAVAIAGDLKIEGATVFKCKKPLPAPGRSGRLIVGSWAGHCWLEIDGVIGDLSLFRTAYGMSGVSRLKEYVVTTFGYGKGAMLCHHSQLPSGIKYIPKFVLSDAQVIGLCRGMEYQIRETQIDTEISD